MFLQEIENGALTGILFSSDSCAICTGLWQQMQERIVPQFPLLTLYQVKIDDYPELKSRFMIFSVPVFIIFFDNKELIRKAGVFGMNEILEPLNRYYPLINS